jgi:prepilin-type N-terminal cleavage/methylation domain-containing protein
MHFRLDKQRVSRSGFTLIELLVVVAIISALIAILIPSLSAAREISNRTLCTTRLKAQGTAFSLYASTYSDNLPVFANTASNWMHDQPTETGDVLLGLTPGGSSAGLGMGGKITSASATAALRKYFYCPSSLLASQSDRAWYSPSSGSATSWSATDPGSRNRAFGYQYINDRRGDGSGLGWALPNRIGSGPKLKWRQKLISEMGGSSLELAWDDITSSGSNDWTTPLTASWIVVNTSHMKGKQPRGENVLCFDGHVEWRNFKLGAATPIPQQGNNAALFYLQNP